MYFTALALKIQGKIDQENLEQSYRDFNPEDNGFETFDRGTDSASGDNEQKEAEAEVQNEPAATPAETENEAQEKQKCDQWTAKETELGAKKQKASSDYEQKLEEAQTNKKAKLDQNEKDFDAKWAGLSAKIQAGKISAYQQQKQSEALDKEYQDNKDAIEAEYSAVTKSYWQAYEDIKAEYDAHIAIKGDCLFSFQQ